MEESKQSKASQYKYHAFISYRHADNKVQGRQWATWLHQAIETYEVPKDLVGKKNGRGDVIPARIYPIFRDEEELPAHADLGTSIVGALEQTNLLVVLCSPRAVASTYVADEIDYFKKLGGSDRIIAAMIDGEPNTSWDTSKHSLGFTKEDECFPIPLQFEYDQDGNPTDKHAEPIAADFRINNNGTPEEGWTTPAAYREHLKATSQLDNKAIDKKVNTYQKKLHLMLLKIIAGILGMPLGELTQRDKEYQLEQERQKAKKLRQWLGAVAMLAILAIGAGVFAYFQKEEAIKAKTRAEFMLSQVRSNVVFMNYDLRNMLVRYAPITVQEEVNVKIDELVKALAPSGELEQQDEANVASVSLNKAKVILKSSKNASTEALPFILKALEIYSLLNTSEPDNLNYLKGLSLSHIELCEFYGIQGDDNAAFKQCSAGLMRAKDLSKRSPGDKSHKKILAGAYGNMGDVQLALKGPAAAMESHLNSLKIYELLNDKNEEDNDIKINLSLSYLNISQLEFRSGKLERAKGSIKSAIDIIEPLALKYPNDYFYSNNLLFFYVFLGSINMKGYSYQFALDSYLQAEEIGKVWLLKDPRNLNILNRLGLVYGSILTSYIKLNYGQEKVIEAYNQGVKYRELLIKLDPQRVSYKKNLALLNENIGFYFDENRRFKKALHYYQLSLDIYIKLSNIHPENNSIASSLASLKNNIGTVYGRMKEIDKALPFFESSRVILEELVNKSPDDNAFKNDLIISIYKIGNSFEVLGDYASARKHYQDSLNLRQQLVNKSPSNMTWQHKLSENFYRLGIVEEKLNEYSSAIKNFKESIATLSILLSFSLDNNKLITQQYQSEIALERVNNKIKKGIQTDPNIPDWLKSSLSKPANQ